MIYIGSLRRMGTPAGYRFRDRKLPPDSKLKGMNFKLRGNIIGGKPGLRRANNSQVGSCFHLTLF